MKRAVVVVLMTAILLGMPTRRAEAFVPPIPGLSAAQWTIFCEVLQTIADMKLDGGSGFSPGLRVLMGHMSGLFDRIYPNALRGPLLWQLRQVFDGIQGIRSQVAQMSTTASDVWHLSPRTLLLRQLYLDPIQVGRVFLSKVFGTIPDRMPGAYLHDAIGYTVASTQSLASRRMNDSGNWATQFGDMYRRSSDTRRSPGEAIRDQAHNLAAKVSINAANADILTQDLTVRQMETALEESDTRAESLVASVLFSDMAGRAIQLPTDPPLLPFAPPTPEPTATPEPDPSDPGSGDSADCERTRPAFLEEVLSAEEQWLAEHPDWHEPNGSGQEIVDSDHWDDYYSGVVAILNRGAVAAEVDPCGCGEIRVKNRGDASSSDQYHVLTSWGQARVDQNAYRASCAPAAF